MLEESSTSIGLVYTLTKPKVLTRNLTDRKKYIFKNDKYEVFPIVFISICLRLGNLTISVPESLKRNYSFHLQTENWGFGV